jgi:uncharacterized membrane protein
MSELWKSFQKSFFAGLVVVVPVAASIAILLGLFNWVTNFLLPEALQSHRGTFLYRIVALVVGVLFVAAVGWLTRLVIGRRMVAVGEAIIGRVPLLNKIYGFMREVSQTMLAGRRTMFQRVVLVEFPRPGVYAIGFVTGEAVGEAQARTQETVINVFVPTTPNPTSGFLVLVPRAQLVALDMSVAEGMKLVISGGTVVPPYTPKTQPPGAAPAG